MNKYQSPISDDIPKKIRDEMIEYIETIPFIKHLISSEKVRGFAKDRPKYNSLSEDHEDNFYNDDRIIVDITKPHILKDMDFFRERAIFYQKNGKYTNITPNPNPKSEYAAFWKEELRRWEHGLVRPSDGEWIPGYLYFYWNYSPIWLVEEDPNAKHKKRQKAKRIREFPKPWLGDYLFFHYVEQSRQSGQHGKLLKMRGCGWSFKAACISPCNMYIFKGSGMANFHLASEKTFLSGDKGVFGKVVDTLDWIAETTPLPRIRLTNSLRSMEIQLGYIDKYGNRKGNLSSVNGISLKDNPEKARGIRGPFIQYEEDGLFPDLETAWGVNREAVESGSSSFGFMMAGGTGGTEGASFEGSRKLFYSPETYNIYGINNVYDKNAQSANKCGFFWGAYMNRHRCYDEVTGEPDIIKALYEIIENRHSIAKNAFDLAALTQARAEKPITPQEAIMRVEGTIFPVADLTDYLGSIKPEEQRFIAQHYVGELVYDAVEGVVWKPNADLRPIRTTNIEKNNRIGAVEIFELPKKGADGKIQTGRYIAGIDPIDADSGESLFSIMVMDLLTDRIVAEYTGRYPKAEQCYEIALKLCIFYNAQANYENNLKGLHSYFTHKNALHYLADTPDILKDMDILKPSLSNPKGTRSTKPINAWGRQLQVTWMLSEAYSQEEESKKLNLHTIRSLGYLEECIVWNQDGNFDRVSAGNMLFILREDRLRRTQQLRKEEVRVKNAWTDSAFFENVYGNKSIKNEDKYKSIFDS